MIANKSDSHKCLQIKVIVINDCKFSSNTNEVIRSILNFLFIYFFYKKILQVQKSTKRLTVNKNKKIRIKDI